MYSKSLILLGTGAALVAGFTPSGFTPVSTNDLMVVYGQVAAVNGALVAKDTTAKQPTLATRSQLSGTSYAVIMIDLDIPSTTNPHTFLHWVQTDLTPSTSATTIKTLNGTAQGFTLNNVKNTSAIVAYTQPGPPAQNPLSHRYTEILVDTSNMTTTGRAALQTAAQTRVGFDINTVLQAAGLTNSVVAGNSFNVSNPGPVSAAGSAGGSSGAGGNSSAVGGAGGSGAGAAGGGTAKASRTGSAGSKSTAAASSAASAAGAAKTASTSSAASTASTASAATAATAAAAAKPSASGTAVTSNLTNSGAAQQNATSGITISGATGGHALHPVTLLAGLVGLFVWAL